MKNKILKIVKWVGIVLVLILIILFFLGLYGQRIENYLMLKSQEKFLEKLEKQKSEILEMQKNDTFGGATPEETLDLYIEALKAGDIELASKYWEVSLEKGDLRVKELDNLYEIVNEKKNMKAVIEEVNNIRFFGVKKVLSNNNISFVYYFTTNSESRYVEVVSGQEIITVIPAGTELKVSNVLRLNPYTNVWKIIQ